MTSAVPALRVRRARASADADLTGEQVVEIAEHLERIEDVTGDEEAGVGRPSDEETELADLEEVVDAAVASAQAEPESDREGDR